MKIAVVAERVREVVATLGRIVVGKDDVLERILAGILANGHVLIEDYPGPRQDAHRPARWPRRSTSASGASSSRPTCCPATSPAASSTTSARAGSSSAPGPVFTNLLLADEINRATPKTQAALLEAMQEAQVTIEGAVVPARASRSSSSPRRTRSSWRAPTRCPRRSSTASCCGSASAIPTRDAEREILPRRRERRTDAATVPTLVTPRRAAGDAGGARGRLRRRARSSATSWRSSRPRATDPRVALGASPRGSLALLKLARAEAAHSRPRLRPARRREGGGGGRARPPARPAAGAVGLADDAGAGGREPARSRCPRRPPSPRDLAPDRAERLVPDRWSAGRSSSPSSPARAELVVVAVPLVVALVVGRRGRRRRPTLRDRVTSVSRRPPVRGRARDRHRHAPGATRRCRWWSCWSRCRPRVRARARAPPRVLHPAGAARRSRWELELALRGPPARCGSAVRTCASGGRSGSPPPRRAIGRAQTVARLSAARPAPAACRGPLRTQTFVGNYVSPAQGEGIEPGDIRPFAPGDQVRHVNWRATLRLGDAPRHPASPGAERRRRAPARHAVGRGAAAAPRSSTRACGPRPRSPPPISRGRTASA